MLVLLSPAKTLNYTDAGHPASQAPALKKHTETLIDILKKKSQKDLMKLMSIKEKLGALNYERYQNFSSSYNKKNSKSAISAFKGDVYLGLDADSLNEKDIEFAQSHVRILSGLYGVLRPLDKMQAYRLEMGTKLKNPEGKNLYDYWGDMITDQLNKDLKKIKSQKVINLASNEYFAAVKRHKLKGEIIDIGFKEYRDGKLKFISFNAKKARGLMTRHIVQSRIGKVEDLKGFDTEGYAYAEEHSGDKSLMFVR